uniref:Uncharacterized protein n=1 Tax=Vitis vinifera TaxID=29760 RepID=A5B7I1_VITVI|nr:hypothetical protein VITISV_043330 [Vitis vinifera]
MVIPPPVKPPRIMKFLKPYVLKMHFTNKFVNAQVIHSPTATVASAASSQEKTLRSTMESTRDVAAAAMIGKILGERLLLQDIPAVTVFLKRDQKYHGKVKAVIDSLREAYFCLIQYGVIWAFETDPSRDDPTIFAPRVVLTLKYRVTSDLIYTCATIARPRHSNISDPDRRFRLIQTRPLIVSRIRYITPDSANLRHGPPRPVVGRYRRRAPAGSRPRQASERHQTVEMEDRTAMIRRRRR